MVGYLEGEGVELRVGLWVLVQVVCRLDPEGLCERGGILERRGMEG